MSIKGLQNQIAFVLLILFYYNLLQWELQSIVVIRLFGLTIFMYIFLFNQYINLTVKTFRSHKGLHSSFLMKICLITPQTETQEIIVNIMFDKW